MSKSKQISVATGKFIQLVALSDRNKIRSIGANGIHLLLGVKLRITRLGRLDRSDRFYERTLIIIYLNHQVRYVAVISSSIASASRRYMVVQNKPDCFSELITLLWLLIERRVVC